MPMSQNRSSSPTPRITSKVMMTGFIGSNLRRPDDCSPQVAVPGRELPEEPATRGPGEGDRRHEAGDADRNLEENVAALGIALTPEDL
jgi:hypothetical protein